MMASRSSAMNIDMMHACTYVPACKESVPSKWKHIQRKFYKMAFCTMCVGWRVKHSLNLLRLRKRFFSTASWLMNDDSPKPTKQFSLTFEEYQTLRRKVRTQKRISGIPFAAVGLTSSSMISVMLNPHLFDATDPEQIQPILWVQFPCFLFSAAALI